jgi:ATP sulfurylase
VNRLLELGFLGASPVQAKGLTSPYAGELEVRLAPAPSVAAVELTERVELDRDGELAAVGLALGLLSPLHGFMGSREAFKVRARHHLERGMPWPAPVILPSGQQVANGTSVALCSGVTRLGSLRVAETWVAREGGARCLAGCVRIERLPAWAAECRDVQVWRIELQGRAPIVAMPLFEFPSLGDEHVARMALELNHHLLLLPLVQPESDGRVLAATRALVANYFDGSRVSVAPIPAPPCGPGALAGFLAIYAQNLGANRLLLPERLLDAEVADSSRTVLDSAVRSIAVDGYPEPFFDERIGGLVSRRTAPQGSGDSAALARARSKRPEVAALEGAPTRGTAAGEP